MTSPWQPPVAREHSPSISRGDSEWRGNESQLTRPLSAKELHHPGGTPNPRGPLHTHTHTHTQPETHWPFIVAINWSGTLATTGPTKRKLIAQKIKVSRFWSGTVHRHGQQWEGVGDAGPISRPSLAAVKYLKRSARMITVTCILSSVLQTHQRWQHLCRSAPRCISGNYCSPITTQLVNIYQINKQHPVN